LDYVAIGYNLDAIIENEQNDEENVNLSEFDDIVEESLRIDGDSPGD
jgi:hypothetical protein